MKKIIFLAFALTVLASCIFESDIQKRWRLEEEMAEMVDKDPKEDLERLTVIAEKFEVVLT